MKNREIYTKDPLSFELLNNGVSKVAEVGFDAEQIKTLRFEMETFVCDGEYANGLDRILNAYLGGMNRPEQQAAWVSGFFGSGKSHLVKMLRYLWEDLVFPDGASARSIVQMPDGIRDMLVELTNRSKAFGGLRAAAGTLGAGNMDNVRIAFLQLVFRAAGLPSNLAAARFILWLQAQGLYDSVRTHLEEHKLDANAEFRNFFVSTKLAAALVAADTSFKDPQNAQAAMRSQFPVNYTPTVDDTLAIIRQIFTSNNLFPCVLLVVDEIQQFLGDKPQRAMDFQEIAEPCCAALDSRLLLVGTGQSALTGSPNLSRLQARFTVKVHLSDTDVETVIRKTVLAKKPDTVKAIEKVLEDHSGEINRHLQNTRIATQSGDKAFYAADYPLLPVRRRFWERVLRNVDASGTKAQLRTQLKIVFDAARESAEQKLGCVVPADYMYDQIATDLLNTGILQREFHEIILGERDGTPNGELRSRLCALIFLISQLPRTPGADDGVRATEQVLADLLVVDLGNDGQRLRQAVPAELESLAERGKLMRVEDEYCLQTREGAGWNHDFNQRRSRIMNDDALLGAEREKLLEEALIQALKPLTLQHGAARQPRKLEHVLSNTGPTQPSDSLILWVRHGWAESEKQVETDARKASSESAMIFGFLPRIGHDDFKQSICAMLAARETLDAHGVPSTPESIQAANAMKTQLEAARQRVNGCLREIIANARVFLGGGNEVSGIEMVDKVNDAAADALHRLFPRFAEADHANWAQVRNNARSGNVGALQAVGYQGETVRHPVCKAAYDFIGAGKKGKEIREQFRAAPFGWPQDAIDAALMILTLAGNLRAAHNNQPVQATNIGQDQIGVVSFHVDIPPLTVVQRLDLKALFQKLEINTPNGQESLAAATFLAKLLELAKSAGGEPPCPEPPSIKPIQELQTESGNAQLLAIHTQKDQLAEQIKAWTQTRKLITTRLPRWRRLTELCSLAADLPESADTERAVQALLSDRSLLSEPDPVPPLIQSLIGALRSALNHLQEQIESAHTIGQLKLESNQAWKKLDAETKISILAQFNIQAPATLSVSTEEEVVSAVTASSLGNRRTLIEAIPQRFNQTLDEALRRQEPKATRINLQSSTITNEAEMTAWLDGAKKQIETGLKKGPVIV
jgi:hypothetical protein